MGRYMSSIIAMALLLCTITSLNAQGKAESTAVDPQVQAKIDQAKQMILGSNFSGASALLEDILTQNPNVGAAHYFLGLAQIGQADKRSDADNFSKHFIEAARNGYHIPYGSWENFPIKVKVYLDANWDPADKFMGQKDPENYQIAIHLLENIVAVDHKSHDASEHLGDLYIKTGQNRMALDLFQRLLESYPDISESIYTLGLAFFDINNTEIAQAILADLSSEGPEKMTALMKLLMSRAFFVLDDYRIGSVYYFQCLDDLNDIAGREMYRDIVDIITPKEDDEWKQARTIEQKKLFLRKFWKSRDPSPTTEYNERLAEHYRRLNYAKQNFTMKQTKGYDDRGIVYIKHGEPDEKAKLVGNFGIRDNETWVYHRKPDNFVFNFVKRSSSYLIANSLVEAVVGQAFSTSFGTVPDPSNEGQDAVVSAQDFTQNWRQLLWSRIEIDPLYFRLYSQKVDFNDPEYLIQEMFTNWQMDEATLVAPALTTGMATETYAPDMGAQPLDYYYYTADFMAMNANSNLNIFYGLPVASLEFKRDIIGVRVNYESTFAVFDQDWNEVDRVYNRRSYQLNQEPDRNNKGLLLVDKQTMNLPPGNYHYSVSIKDLGNEHLGIYKGDIEVSHYQPNQFNVSQIIMASNITPFDGGKPGKFTRGQFNVMPLPSRTFHQEQSVFVYYEVYFLTPGSDQKKQYHVDFTIQADKLDRNLAGKVFSPFGKLFNRSEDKGKITLTFEKEGDPERIAQQEYVSIDISDSPPGRYDLTIVVTDMASGKTITRRTEFYIVRD